MSEPLIDRAGGPRVFEAQQLLSHQLMKNANCSLEYIVEMALQILEGQIFLGARTHGVDADWDAARLLLVLTVPEKAE